MKINTFGVLAFTASTLFAGSQFTNIYETTALCTTVEETPYCYLTKNSDVFAVINYQEEAGNILLLKKNYPEYIPVGTQDEKEVVDGIFVITNDYINKATGEKYNIVYTDNDLSFRSQKKGENFCQIVMYWSYDKTSFKKTYEFREVFSLDKIKELNKRCLAEPK